MPPNWESDPLLELPPPPPTVTVIDAELIVRVLCNNPPAPPPPPPLGPPPPPPPITNACTVDGDLRFASAIPIPPLDLCELDPIVANNGISVILMQT
jgi:hypothetical protein